MFPALRSPSLCSLFIILCTQNIYAQEDWVFLKDGRVGLADRAQSPMTLTYSDGRTAQIEKDALAGFRTKDHMRLAIDAIVTETKRGVPLKSHLKRLQIFRDAAVPDLLRHLSATDPLTQMIALYALQFCWTRQALDPVLATLKSKDKQVHQAALAVLVRHLSSDELARCLRPFLKSEDLNLAGIVFESIPPDAPNPELVARLLGDPSCWCHLCQHLPRYESPTFSPDTRRMLHSKNKKEQSAALAALIHQNDNTPETRAAVSTLLKSSNPLRRELAAEYLAWHGTKQEEPSLKRALAKESDTYAKASLRASLKSIGRRTLALPTVTELKASQLPAGTTSAQLTQAYSKALSGLSMRSGEEALRTAFGVYAWNTVTQRYWIYGRTDPEPEFINLVEAKQTLQARLFGIPGLGAASPKTDHSPTAADFVPPVRDYFDPKRTSFGFRVPAGSTAFSDSVHIGDDVTWNEPHRTVVAIGNGIVQSVKCTHSWGYIIIVEHTLPDKSKVCSLYAHLSPFVHVRPGDSVKRGQKLGAIGRGNTWENGGYLPHLHFGVHKGSYLKQWQVGETVACRFKGAKAFAKVVESKGGYALAQIIGTEFKIRLEGDADWICGYISPAKFKSGGHGWMDPQSFIKNPRLSAKVFD